MNCPHCGKPIDTGKPEEVQTYYLNNSGSRWKNVPTETFRVICESEGYDKLRKVEYWEAIGNFAVPFIKYHQKYTPLAIDDTFDENGIRVGRII